MKKRLLYLFMFICTVGLFTNCSDDDDVNYPVDTELAGAYKGTMDVYYVGVDAPIVSDLVQKVYISKASDSAIKLELKNFAITVAGTNLTIGDITVDNCPLSQSGDIYSFTGNQTLNLVVGSCDVSVTGTIGKNAVNMVINVDVQGGMKVRVNYDGSKLSGNESAMASITSFTFDSDVVTEQPLVNEEAGTITFKVADDATAEQLMLTPSIEVSPKAIVTPNTNVAQDFSKAVSYRVTAEDGTSKQYVVSIASRQNVLKYSFENWATVGEGPALHEEPMPQDQLASSVQGAALLFIFGIEGFPVYKTTDALAGDYGIKLVTMDTSLAASALVPAVTSGSVYTGSFDINFAMTDKLKCTKFGIPYDKKPLNFRGWYKYTPGETFIDGSDYTNIQPIHGKVDECAIQAVLYKVTSADETLDGHTINASDNIVAVAKLADGSAKSAYTYFDLPFEYVDGKTYESGAMYKLAIVCSSSKEGDNFKGAGNSTLFLDELEVIGE